ncbi:MAG: hypothetical protein HY077_03550 [Elusimicrobia bacterium]|nr:hypothetical protein [Elusimicrobiota bacterium]
MPDIAGRIRRGLSLALAASLIALSPGLSPYEALAVDFEAPGGKIPITVLPGVKVELGKGISVPGAEIPGGLVVPGTEIPGAGVEGALVLPSAPSGLVPEVRVETPAPGTPQAEAAALGRLGETLQPQIEAAASAANEDPRSNGETIERLIESRRTGSDIIPAAELPNPYGLYEHAYPIALAKAQELGKKPAQVHFYEASASVPGVDGASWKFAFYLTEKETTPEQLSKDKPKIGDIVYVDFNRTGLASVSQLKVSDDPHLDAYLQTQLAGQTKFVAPRSYAQSYEAPRVSVYKQAPLSADWVPFTADPAYFKIGSQGSAQSALEGGRAQGLKGGVSVSFKLREEPVSGDKDYWYHFYDGKGGEYLANGRSREARFLQ